MDGIAGDDMIGQVEVRQQLLSSRDFVGFLVDINMRQHQRGVGCERAEHLLGLGVVEAVEAAFERLAVERDNAHTASLRRKVELAGMFAEGPFNIRRRKPLQNVADGGVRGRPFPTDPEGLVEFLPMHFDEGADAAIGIGAAHNRQDGKQQHMRQLIELAFGAPRIGNHRQQREELFE
jgi:hypothetical protein